MKKNVIISFIIVAILFGGGGFYWGVYYQKSQITVPDFFQMDPSQGPRGMGNINGSTNRGNGPAGFGGMTRGEVLSVDGRSVVVKLQEGGSKTIYYSYATTVQKSTSGSISDVQVGETVMVNGSSNSDGSVTAQTIQLVSAFDTAPQ